MAPKVIPKKARKAAVKKGQALPTGKKGSGGKFPVRNRDELRRAIQSFGRAKPGDKARVKAHIKRQAAKLGATKSLPPNW